MNRTPFKPTRRGKSRRPWQRRWSYRPDLIALEDRTLLSVTTTTFALDPPNSSLTLSGTINGRTISQQGPGSLTTTYSGTVSTNWDLDARTIQFNSAGSVVTAANSGSWQPNVGGGSGSAPANYGAMASFSISICSVTARVAVRGLVASTSSSPLSLTPSGPDPYTFASTQTLAITAGTADYTYSSTLCGSGSGTTSVADQSAQNQASARGVFQDQGNGAYALVMPISVTISQSISTPLGSIPVVLHINGTLRANAHIPFVVLSDGSGGHYDYATRAVATQGPVHITDPAAQVTDTGASTLTSMTATLTNHPDGAQEFLAADLTGTGLSGSYNPATGTETITGSASAAVYTTALQRLTYENDSHIPDTHDRIVQVVARDATNSSVVRTSTVGVSAPADHFTVTTSAASPDVAGTPFDVTVTALDADGNIVPGYTGTVTFSSADPYGAAFSPTSYTFTAGDAGVHTFPGGATLFTAGTWDVTATDTAGITGAANVNVIAAPAVAFAIAVPPSVQSGVPFSITVSAVDPYGNVDTNYVTDPSGVVTFYTTTDPDPGVVLPSNYQFTASDAGVVTFSGVVYITPGVQDINAVDTVSGIAGSNTVIVTGGDGPDIPLGPGRGSQPAPSATPADRRAFDSVFALLDGEWRGTRISVAPIKEVILSHRLEAALVDDLDWAAIG
jgi:hypothetical protein